jgi:hypothetical protein
MANLLITCFSFSHLQTKMAPSSTSDIQPTAPYDLSTSTQRSVDRKIFPDGIKTSGQHPPLYDLIRPYSDFPTKITGETVWQSEDYANNPERWVHVFNDEQIYELSIAADKFLADKFLADKIPLTGISKVSTGVLYVEYFLTIVGQLSPS